MHHCVTSAGRAVIFEPEEKYFLIENVSSRRRLKRILNETGPTGVITDGYDSKKNNESSDFSAEKFVKKLLTEGCKHPCDETSDVFNENTDIPNFYNENLFRKGQAFFYKHIFSLLLSNILGLIILLSLPESLNILKMTNKSSTPMTAYKRYVATVFHMMTWYDSDFKPGSSSWASLRKVRLLHNSSSNQSNFQLKYRINQKYMSLTLFGFMGMGLVRSKMLGIHQATEEEWKGFIHLWRVIGYALGIEDRFNICRDSVADTEKICHLLVEEVFIPAMEKPSDDFHVMTKAMLEGLWAMSPVLQHDVFIRFAHMVLEDTADPNYKSENLPELTGRGMGKLKLILGVMKVLRYRVVRILLNFTQVASLWIMKVCPFLAFYKFGLKNSYVKI